MKVYDVAIYLKSGAVIRGRFKKFEVTRNSNGVGYSSLGWVNHGFPKILTIQVDDISAVTVEAEAEEEVDDE